MEHWEDPFPKPKVEKVRLDESRSIRVVRDDLFEYGTKARAASACFANAGYAQYDTVVYVAPRAGWAPISLAKLCRDLGKRLILFCPAAQHMSAHQTAAYELGAEMRFVRIAAMPVLQNIAKRFAEKHGYLFFPLGLAVPEAVAGVGKVAKGLGLKKVEEVWCVISTGVLTRGLQLAWPDARHYAVAVARNIHEGEKGTAELFSHPKPFLQNVKAEWRPPFNSVGNYDAAAWEYVVKHASDGAVLWNVAGELEAKELMRPTLDSARDWHDYSDIEKE